MLVAMLCVSVFLCVFLRWCWQYWRMVAMAGKVPIFTGVLPVIGHTHLFLRKTSRELFELVKRASEHANENGGITTVWLRMKPHFIITNPKDAVTALNTCLEKNYIYYFFEPWVGGGLFTAKMPTWLNHRRMINPAFSPQVLTSFQGVFDKQARKLARELEPHVGGKPFDAGALIGFTLLETVYETAFGISSDGDTVDHKFNEACHQLFGIIVKRFLNSLLHFNCIFRWSSLKREQDDLIKVLHKSSNDIIQRRKLEFNNNNNNNHDYSKEKGPRFKPFLQLLLELTAAKGVFTDEQLREEVDTMLVAGQDTSALVLQYIILMLGAHQNVQDKAYEELKDIFGDSDRDVQKDDLNKMVFMEAVINETLRLYPIGMIIARDIETDLELTQHTLPAGGTVFVSFWGIHRGPEWGPDPHRFRPGRWLDPTTLPDVHSTFGGFSIGKRMCIGKSYAMMSMKTTLVHLLRHYRIKADDSNLELKLDILLRPVSGHHISIEAR